MHALILVGCNRTNNMIETQSKKLSLYNCLHSTNKTKVHFSSNRDDCLVSYSTRASEVAAEAYLLAHRARLKANDAANTVRKYDYIDSDNFVNSATISFKSATIFVQRATNHYNEAFKYADLANHYATKFRNAPFLNMSLSLAT
ncbi:hypothetical protein ACRRVB_01910 [Candidatus Cardinium hertigii]|uniref:hypothetical protein n=1 Tax=Candidatus Cardinium hertigii TaxID=247481 RepID=UPI003D7C53CF